MSTEALSPYLVFAWDIATALAIFAIGWWLSKLAYKQVSAMAQKRAKDTMLSRFLASLAQWAVVAAAAITALGRVGVETTSLVALLASAGVAIGLALQGNLSNFASGVMLLVFRPLNVGDVVTAGGHTGTVEDVGIFASTLVTPENHTIILGNSVVMGGPIINYTKRGTRRGTVEVGVAYGADLQQVRAVLLAAAEGSEHTRDDPGVGIAFVNLGASSLDFAVHVWSLDESTNAYLTMLDDVRSRIYDGLNDAGIDIPFSQIVVHQAPTDA